MASKVDYSNVNILFFAKAKELVKKSSLEIELPSRFGCLDDLLQQVESKFPELKVLNRCFVLALNEDYLVESDNTDKPKSFDKTFSNSIKNGWLTTGPQVRKFEKILQDYTQADYVIAVNSCTAALHLALAANGFSNLIKLSSTYLSRFQSGYVYHYAFAMFGGLVILLTWFVYY